MARNPGEDNYRELLGEENYLKIRSEVESFSKMEEGFLQDALLRQIYCSNNSLDPDFRCRKTLFLNYGNRFSREIIEKILGFLEGEKEASRLKKIFLVSMVINKFLEPREASSHIADFCFQKLLENEDGKELLFQMFYQDTPAPHREKYARAFISKATEEDSILVGLNQGVFKKEVAESAVLRMWEIKQDKSNPREWVLHILQNVAPYKDSGVDCAIHVYAALARLFPDVFEFEKEISAMHCFLLCIYKGKEWRELHRKSIQDVFMPSSMADTVGYLAENFTLPAKDFVQICLEFGGNPFYPGESSFYLSSFYGVSSESAKILSILNRYLDEEYPDGEALRAVQEVKEFADRFRGEEGERKYMSAEWQEVSNGWSRLYEKIGAITTQLQDRENESYPNGNMVF